MTPILFLSVAVQMDYLFLSHEIVFQLYKQQIDPMLEDLERETWRAK
jgi:hypothetical protein